MRLVIFTHFVFSKPDNLKRTSHLYLQQLKNEVIMWFYSISITLLMQISI